MHQAPSNSDERCQPSIHPRCLASASVHLGLHFCLCDTPPNILTPFLPRLPETFARAPWAPFHGLLPGTLCSSHFIRRLKEVACPGSPREEVSRGRIPTQAHGNPVPFTTVPWGLGPLRHQLPGSAHLPLPGGPTPSPKGIQSWPIAGNKLQSGLCG